VTVERIDGGKTTLHRSDVVGRGRNLPPRNSGLQNIERQAHAHPAKAWSDAVVIYPREILAFQNIERQAHALRAKGPRRVVQTPRRHPRSREDYFEAPPDEGGGGRFAPTEFWPSRIMSARSIVRGHSAAERPPTPPISVR
jgi:hypothetical protein